MPPPYIVGAATWEIQMIVKEAQLDQPDPGTGPANLLFLLVNSHFRVLQLGYSFKLTCHPGVQQSRSLLQPDWFVPVGRPPIALCWVSPSLACA